MASPEEQTKQKIEELGRDWETFKKENDARLQKLEKNAGVADFEEKLGKINSAIDGTTTRLKELDAEKQAREALEKRLEAMEVRGNRPGKSGGASKEAEEYRDAFIGGFMRKGNETNLLAKATSVGVDADGGYAVPETLDTEILKLLRDQSPMRQLATVVTVGNEEYKQLVNLNGATGGWVGESDARPETNTPKLGQFAPTFGELYANPAATQKALDDMLFNVETWFSEEISQVFSEKEGSAFISGTGTAQPKGLLAYTMAATGDATRAYGTFEKMSSAAAGVISGDDLISLVYKLKAGYRQSASMMLNGATLAAVRKLKDTTGNYLWQPSLQLGVPSMLVGYAVAENEDMPALASGAYAIAFSDFKRAYKIFDVRGIRTLRDPYTHKPYVHFYSTKRVGGGSPNTQAAKFLQIA